jgi:hypothetical protein
VFGSRRLRNEGTAASDSGDSITRFCALCLKTGNIKNTKCRKAGGHRMGNIVIFHRSFWQSYPKMAVLYEAVLTRYLQDVTLLPY